MDMEKSKVVNVGTVVHPERQPLNSGPGSNDYRGSCYESSISCYGSVWGFLGTACCCCCPPYLKVEQGYVGVVKKFGRFVRVVSPGLNYYVPFVETIESIDTRIITLDLERQNLLSRDNISVNVDVVMNYKIVDVQIACFAVRDLRQAITQCAYSTIRSIFGNKTLQEVLEKRVEIAAEVADMVEHDARSWGVHILSINIKDVIIPHEMIQSLSAAPIAKRNAEAKLILAQADVESAKLMRAASDILNTESAMQIRYLEQVAKLAASPNTKIVFFPGSSRGESAGMQKMNIMSSIEQ